MDNVTLREYRPGDWQAMHALDLVCFEPVFQFSRGAMHRFAEAPGAIVVLAETAAELVGCCVVNMEQQTGYVVTLDVAPPWRRRGLARRMMAEAETRLRAAGKPTVPTLLGDEKKANVFLRADDPAVIASVRMKGSSAAEIFGELRERKNKS